MNFSLSEEQQALKDTVNRFVQTQYAFETRRKIVSGETGFSQTNWELFAELGWLMVPFSEADGGLGGSAADLMVLMEEFGRGLVVEPFLTTAVLCGKLIGIAGDQAQRAELIPAIIEGRLQLAFAHGELGGGFDPARIATRADRDGDRYTLNGHKSVVLNGPNAAQFIVAARTSGETADRDGVTLLLVDAGSAGVSVQPYPTVDGQRAAEVRFAGVQVPVAARLGAEGEGLAVIGEALRWATLAVCAEAVGIMDVLVEKTVEYSKARKQFGVPIGSFQSLQHRMVEMFMEHQQAKSILLMAAMKLEEGGPEAGRHMSAAKSRIGRAARLIGQEAVQLHGGMGMSEELDVGHYFKRLTAIETLFGNSDYHTRQFAAAAD